MEYIIQMRFNINIYQTSLVNAMKLTRRLVYKVSR